MELIPAKATFAPGEPIEIEVRGADGAVTVSLLHLERVVATADVAAGETRVSFPAQPEGGYGIDAGDERTAFDVLADPLARARYGFVSDYTAGRETDGVVENVRRLHLNAIQFYDWMYRHAQLLPPTDDFIDALDRPLSLAAVRSLVAVIAGAGSLPIGYAAVYAAGVDEWPQWQDEALYRANGQPWTLGEDFLWDLDPSAERWRQHFAADLQASATQVGFAGFHLDQYGAPKLAFRRDGTPVDLSEAFPSLINFLASELPDARLIFNNVNNFPTWATAAAEQAAVYIEVWPPHVRLGDLARLIGAARSYAPGKSVILAAYLSVYATASDEKEACAAQNLLHATAFSHGGTVLLHGETQAALTEAYYVTHKQLSDASQEAGRHYFDFAVRYGDLLFDRNAVDVTTTHFGGVNEEITAEAPVPLAVDARPGSVWVRVINCSSGLLLSLIDLSREEHDLWDAPHKTAAPLTGVRLSIERRRRSEPRVLFASPEDQPALVEISTEWNGRYDSFELPAFRTWALVWLPDEERA